MKKILLLIVLLLGLGNINAQSFVIMPEGVTDGNGNTSIIIEENGMDVSQIKSAIKAAIKSNIISSQLKIEDVGNSIIVSDLKGGFTKTDGKAGSAYQFNLTYNITFDIKDGKVRYEAPKFILDASQKFNEHSQTWTSGTQFEITMGIQGKNDVWSNKEKKFFIYNQDNKLKEPTTKNKLEEVFNSYIPLLKNLSKVTEW